MQSFFIWVPQKLILKKDSFVSTIFVRSLFENIIGKWGSKMKKGRHKHRIVQVIVGVGEQYCHPYWALWEKQRACIRIVSPRELGIYSQIIREPLIPDLLWFRRPKKAFRQKERCLLGRSSWCLVQVIRKPSVKGIHVGHWQYQLKCASWNISACGNATIATKITNMKF